jgi:hypothetical protein
VSAHAKKSTALTNIATTKPSITHSFDVSLPST